MGSRLRAQRSPGSAEQQAGDLCRKRPKFSRVTLAGARATRDARDALEIRGFRAAVLKVRIQLPPARSLLRTSLSGRIPSKNRRLESSPLEATAVGMRQAGYLVHRAERLGEITRCKVEARRGVWGCAQPGTIAEGGEEDVSGTAIGTVLSAGIVDVFSDEVVNAAGPLG